MMLDFKINPLTWDLVIEDGQIAIVEDLDEVVQRVAVACKTHLGEWTFNTDLGLPWSEEILVKAPDLELIDARIRALIVSVEDVTELRSLDLTYDPSARTLTVDFEINTIYGPGGALAVL